MMFFFLVFWCGVNLMWVCVSVPGRTILYYLYQVLETRSLTNNFMLHLQLLGTYIQHCVFEVILSLHLKCHPSLSPFLHSQGGFVYYFDTHGVVQITYNTSPIKHRVKGQYNHHLCLPYEIHISNRDLISAFMLEFPATSLPLRTTYIQNHLVIIHMNLSKANLCGSCFDFDDDILYRF